MIRPNCGVVILESHFEELFVIGVLLPFIIDTYVLCFNL